MIFTKTYISGIQYIDYQSLNVISSISENNTSSSFQANFDSPYGRHKTDFTVGNDVQIYAGSLGSSLIFRGIIDSVDFDGEGLTENLTLRGRDYMARLIDNTVTPVVYTNVEVGSIVRDIITSNLTDIGSKNINTTQTTLKRISFNQIPIYDAIKQLADISNYMFYIGSNTDLHFEPLGSVFSNVTISGANLISANYDKTREGMANKVWVYGDRYLAAAPTETLTVNVAISGGSVYSLVHKPYNVSVSILGSVRVGGIFGMSNSPPSGTILPVYFVNFQDKQLIFPSGTSFGFYMPPNAGSLIVNYNREVPIVKYGDNRQSVMAFGPKTLVINDKTIKDPNTAVTILKSKLNDSNPFNNIEAKLKGWFSFCAGQTVNMNVPDFNLNISGLNIVEINYDFNQDTVNSEEVIKLKLDRREIDLTDKIRELKNRLDYLESQDRQNTDAITRLEYTAGSMLIVGSVWKVKVQWLGSEFRLWGSNNAPPLGSNAQFRLGLLNASAQNGAGSVNYLASGTFGYGYTTIAAGSYSY